MEIVETTRHIRIKSIEGNNVDILYPRNLAEDVIINGSDYTNVPNSVTNLDDLLTQLGELAFEDSVAMNVGNGDEYGLVKTSDATNESDLVLEEGESYSDYVPTSRALFDTRDSINTSLSNKVSTSGNETISGVKTFTDGIVIGNIKISYDSTTNTLITEPLPEQSNS